MFIQDETRTLYMVAQERERTEKDRISHQRYASSGLRIHLYISMFSVRHTGVTIRLRLMTSHYKLMSHNTKDAHISFLTLRTKESQKRSKHNISI